MFSYSNIPQPQLVSSTVPALVPDQSSHIELLKAQMTNPQEEKRDYKKLYLSCYFSRKEENCRIINLVNENSALKRLVRDLLAGRKRLKEKSRLLEAEVEILKEDNGILKNMLQEVEENRRLEGEIRRLEGEIHHTQDKGEEIRN